MTTILKFPLTPMGVPYLHERKFSDANVCGFTFKHLPQLPPKFWNPRTIFENTPLCPPK